MPSARITTIYARLARLFAQQRESLLAAAATDFELQDQEEFASRQSRIVRLYQELARLKPGVYRSISRDRTGSSNRKAA